MTTKRGDGKKFTYRNKLSFFVMESYVGLCWESVHFNVFINAVEKG